MNIPVIGTGGPVFWIIAASGVIAVLLFVSRWFALRRARIDYADFLDGVTNVLARGNESEALATPPAARKSGASTGASRRSRS